MSRSVPRKVVHRSRRWLTGTAGAAASARWHLRDARAVGRRARVRGWPLITNPDLHVGDDLEIWSHYRTTHLGGTGRLVLGDRVFLNAGVVVLSFVSVEVGDDVALASEVFVSDSDNHAVGDAPLRQEPVRIGDGSWVATRAMVLAGVTIGRRAVVAAGSVVVDDVDDDVLVAGVPARPVRTIRYPPGRRTAWKD
jgi:acetyltransferase-like isoleucine patch superfamily enzyme